MKYIPYCAILAAAAALAGCSREPVEPPAPVPAERVLLMYDNINNDGSKPFSENVRAAGEAVAEGALDADERVIVYEKLATGDVVYELVRDNAAADGYSQRELKKYAQGENSSIDAATMGRVLADIRRAIPAAHYGFAFGSHGLGWIPKSVGAGTIARSSAWKGAADHPFAEVWAERENPLTRYFQGYGKLDVLEFVDALDDFEWDFIILDDCFMASVEALYDMRGLADYIIASPTEILIEGFPYDRVVRTVFAGWPDAEGVGREFVEYYRAKPKNQQSATVAVVKTAQMDALAETVRALNLKINELASVEGIQYYERISRPAHLFYDLDDYLRVTREATMPTEYKAFKEQLKLTVTCSEHTDSFYSQYRDGTVGGAFVPITSYSGLAVFIPWSRTASMLDMYRQTAWYKYVYGGE